jgi:hypothetical protein
MLNYQSRKRTAGEIDGVISNGTHSNKLKTHKVNQMENRHSESLYHSSEAVVALAARNPMTANASVNHKVKLFLTYVGLSSRLWPSYHLYLFLLSNIHLLETSLGGVAVTESQTWDLVVTW